MLVGEMDIERAQNDPGYLKWVRQFLDASSPELDPIAKSLAVPSMSARTICSPKFACEEVLKNPRVAPM